MGCREGISEVSWSQSRNKSVQTIIDAALVRQIDTLTLFAFSSENWNRPNDEITILMSLFNESITSTCEN